MISSRGRKGKQVASSFLKDDAPTKRCFFALRSRGEKSEESDDDGGEFSLSCCLMSSF